MFSVSLWEGSLINFEGHPSPSRSGQLWGRRATHPSLIREEGDRNGARVFPEAHPYEVGQFTLSVGTMAHPQKKPGEVMAT